MDSHVAIMFALFLVADVSCYVRGYRRGVEKGWAASRHAVRWPKGDW